jgi:small subunit ribosomal protein S19
MSRSSKKGPFVQERLLSRITAMNVSGSKNMIRTWSRSSTFFPEMVGHTIAVHDGRKHVPVFIDSIFPSRRSSTNGPFFALRLISGDPPCRDGGCER